MSAFSALDEALDPQRYLRYLDTTAATGSRMKHYVASAHAMRRSGAPILDVGCGGGHDLALLNSMGVRSVGVDQSHVALLASAARVAGSQSLLVRAQAEALPFRNGVFGGARIERVLLHVAEPAHVLREAVRCVEPGGLLTVYEPDWSSLRVRTDYGDEAANWLCSARNPNVGGQLWGMIEDAGCLVLDRVEELSVWRRLDMLDLAVGLDSSMSAAISAGG